MPDPATFSLKDLFAEVAHFQQVMDQVHTSLRNPADKAKLGELLAHLRKARAEAEEKLPPILHEKLQNAQKAKVEMEDLSTQLKEKMAVLQALKMQADGPATKIPSPPSPPEIAFDPKRGQDLRIELLKAYGGLIINERFS